MTHDIDRLCRCQAVVRELFVLTCYHAEDGSLGRKPSLVQLVGELLEGLFRLPSKLSNVVDERVGHVRILA